MGSTRDMDGETGEELRLLEASSNNNDSNDSNNSNNNNNSNNSNNSNNDESKSHGTSSKGVLAAFSHVLLSVVSASTVQLIERRIPDLELNTFRCVIPLMLYCLAALVYIRRWPVIERAQIPYVMMYAFLALTSSVAIFSADAILPLTMVTCISYTVQITGGIIIFRIFVKEPITVSGVLAALLCMSGVVLMMQPTFIFGGTKPSLLARVNVNLSARDRNVSSGMRSELFTSVNVSLPFQDENDEMCKNASTELNQLDSTSSSDYPFDNELEPNHRKQILHFFGYLLPALGGLTLLLDVLLVKKRPYLTDNIVAVSFWSFSITSILSIILTFAIETPVVPRDWFDWTMALTHGLSYALHWPVYMYASGHVTGTTFNLINTSSTVLMLVAQYTFLSSILPGHRNWMEVFGALMVTFGVSISSLSELCSRIGK